VKVGFGTAGERSLDTLNLSEAMRILSTGEFPAGSMGPKVTACVRFVQWGGKMGVISSLEKAVDALAGVAGTRILPDP
jgi:carbamate kinase